MNIDKELLDILVCPETKQPVKLASDKDLQNINERISSSMLTNRAGDKVTEKLEAGLLREDGKIIYPIRNGIPAMLSEEGIMVSV